jgi:hypothetical protein
MYLCLKNAIVNSTSLFVIVVAFDKKTTLSLKTIVPWSSKQD